MFDLDVVCFFDAMKFMKIAGVDIFIDILALGMSYVTEKSEEDLSKKRTTFVREQNIRIYLS